MSSILHASPPDDAVPKAADWINDLTYSDDENDSIWDLLEQNYSSPEGQEPPSSLNDSFPPQDTLFHPLARGESYLSAMSDEGSYLAFSVSTTPGEEERANSNFLSYGSIEDPFKKPGFRHAPSLVDRKKHVPIQQSLPRPKEISPTNINSNINNHYRLHSPLPTHHEESPLTSATATDVTVSPATEEEKRRIESILEKEAKQKSRRHKRLKKIRKAAEAREAEVQRVRGVEQPFGGRNDKLFGGIFVMQFVMVAVGALVFGLGALSDDMSGRFERENDYNPFAGLETDDIIISSAIPDGVFNEELEGHGAEVVSTISHIDYVNVIQLVTIASGYASLCSLLALGFMMMLSMNILHVMLIFAISASMVCTILGMVISYGWIIPIVGAASLVLSSIYTLVVWDRIHLASTNLRVALKCMKRTLDIPLVGVGALLVSFFWTIWCICSFVGVFDFLSDCEQLSDDWMVVVIIFYILTYCWTIQGISQATVAGIVGKWWNHKDSLHMCSSALQSTLHRSFVQSFGSICIGALVLDPCVLYHRICNFLRLAKSKLNSSSTPDQSQKKENHSTKTTSCSFEDNVIHRNVNQWSYTYIGLYGYKFWESGSKASQLFEARGWSNVVSDDLILSALTISTMVIGGSTALLGLIVEEVDGFSFTTLHKPVVTAFLVGLVVGLVLSNTFLSIIEGAVNAILVCYATDPVDFHANHPLLSAELKSVWKEFWLTARG
ncbi:hypothetical protein ACHAXN_011255 [Cyclotella atomus]